MKLDLKNAWGSNTRLKVGKIKRQLHKARLRVDLEEWI